MNNNLYEEFTTLTDLMIFYQSTIRNIAIYISISFGALVYSRYYRDKNNIFSIILVLISIISLIISLIINIFLNIIINRYKNNPKYSKINKWIYINIIIYIIQIILIILASYTLYKLIIKYYNTL